MKLFNRKKSPSNNTIQNSTANSKVKGGINIDIETTKGDLLAAILKLHDHIDRIEKKQIEMISSQNKMNMAFKIYVENNGVKPEVKKIVKEILEEK